MFVLFPARGLLERHARQHTAYAALLAEIRSRLADAEPTPPPGGPQPPYEPPSDSELRVRATCRPAPARPLSAKTLNSRQAVRVF